MTIGGASHINEVDEFLLPEEGLLLLHLYVCIFWRREAADLAV